MDMPMCSCLRCSESLQDWVSGCPCRFRRGVLCPFLRSNTSKKRPAQWPTFTPLSAKCGSVEHVAPFIVSGCSVLGVKELWS